MPQENLPPSMRGLPPSLRKPASTEPSGWRKYWDPKAEDFSPRSIISNFTTPISEEMNDNSWAGALYNRFLRPMTSPLGMGTTLAAGPIVSKLAGIVPGGVQTIVGGMTALAGGEIPHVASRIREEGLTPSTIAEATDIGGAMFGGGTLARRLANPVRGRTPVVNQEVIPEPLGLPAKGQSTQPIRFYQGKLGTADDTLDYPAVGHTGTINPMDAAERGLGSIRGQNPDPAQLHPAFNALVPSALRPEPTPIIPIGMRRNSKPDYTTAYPEGGIINDTPKVDIPGASESNPITSTIEKLRAAIRGAKKLRGTQDEILSEERSKRLGQAFAVTTPGEAGFKQRMSALGGEMPKVEFEGIRSQLNQGDLDNLTDHIYKTNQLTGYEKIRGEIAFQNMLAGGKVPGQSDLNLLTQIFGKDLTEDILARRTFGTKAKDQLSQLVGDSKVAKTLLDLSFPGRQAYRVWHRPEFWKSLGPMYSAAFSRKKYAEQMNTIRKDPNFEFGQQVGLDITDTSGIREEAFVRNHLERMPLIKELVGFGHRGHVMMGNKIRQDYFNSLLNGLRSNGVNTDTSEGRDQARLLAEFVNSATGRGNLGRKLSVLGNELNTALFSPRYVKSRLDVFDPRLYYQARNPAERSRLKEGWKSALTMAGTLGSALSLSEMAGANITSDHNDPDFGKARFGDEVVDFGGGNVQNLRLAAQLTDHIYGMAAGIGAPDTPAGRRLGTYLRSKSSPVAGELMTFLFDSDFKGDPFEWGNVPKNLAAPIILEAMFEFQDPQLAPLWTLLEFHGIPVQTY